MIRILPILFLFLVSSCGRNIEAERAAMAIELSAINYSRNMEKVVEGFIQDYRMRAREKADRLSEDAIKSITKTVNGERVANPINIQVILKQKAKHYTHIERNVISMRKKIMAANRDIDHIIQYSQALKKYFNAKTSFSEMLNETSETVIEVLDAFVGKGDDE